MAQEQVRQEQLRAPVWVRDEQRRRTALTREAIVRAAILLADAEGLDAVSIRRVASELQARAMSLYTYIERKEDLFDLMADEVAAEVLVPGELPRDWREATVVIARREREATRRHPWMIDLVARRSMAGHVGPNMLRHLEQTLAALAHLEADEDAKLRLAAAVSDYTTGFVVREAREREAVREDPEDRERLQSYLRRIAASGEYPHLAPLLGSGLRVDSVDTFDSGLVWILDGFAQHLERREPPSRELPSRQLPSQQLPSQESPSRELPNREPVSREPASRGPRKHQPQKRQPQKQGSQKREPDSRQAAEPDAAPPAARRRPAGSRATRGRGESQG